MISSCPQMFFKIGVLKNFANFTGKHLCWSLFLIKFQTLRPATLLKRDSRQVFSCTISKFLRALFLKNTSGGCFCTYYTHMTSHAIWVDEITDITISIKALEHGYIFSKYSWNLNISVIIWACYTKINFSIIFPKYRKP